jgi:hypothetical protein
MMYASHVLMPLCKRRCRCRCRCERHGLHDSGRERAPLLYSRWDAMALQRHPPHSSPDAAPASTGRSHEFHLPTRLPERVCMNPLSSFWFSPAFLTPLPFPVVPSRLLAQESRSRNPLGAIALRTRFNTLQHAAPRKAAGNYCTSSTAEVRESLTATDRTEA